MPYMDTSYFEYNISDTTLTLSIKINTDIAHMRMLWENNGQINSSEVKSIGELYDGPGYKYTNYVWTVSFPLPTFNTLLKLITLDIRLLNYDWLSWIEPGYQYQQRKMNCYLLMFSYGWSSIPRYIQSKMFKFVDYNIETKQYYVRQLYATDVGELIYQHRYIGLPLFIDSNYNVASGTTIYLPQNFSSSASSTRPKLRLALWGASSDSAYLWRDPPSTGAWNDPCWTWF